MLLLILALFALPFLTRIAFSLAPISAHLFGGHLHLLPGTPRSVVESRRMGLA